MAHAAAVKTNRGTPWVGRRAGARTPSVLLPRKKKEKKMLLPGRTLEDLLYLFGYEHQKAGLVNKGRVCRRTTLDRDPLVGLVRLHVHQVFQGRERLVGFENARGPG